jgi:hypothetical protein
MLSACRACTAVVGKGAVRGRCCWCKGYEQRLRHYAQDKGLVQQCTQQQRSAKAWPTTEQSGFELPKDPSKSALHLRRGAVHLLAVLAQHSYASRRCPNT